MAATQTASNIKRALDSKQYNSALTSLSQNARAVDDCNYLPSQVGGNALETMKSQARSFDKILKIRLSELSTASSSYLAAIIKEFRLQIKDDIEDATTTMDGIGEQGAQY